MCILTVKVSADSEAISNVLVRDVEKKTSVPVLCTNCSLVAHWMSVLQLSSLQRSGVWSLLEQHIHVRICL